MKLFSFFKSLGAKTHIAMGMSFLVTSALLAAAFLGLVPDRAGAIRDGRTALSEAMAASSTALLSRGDLAQMEPMLRLVVKRNPDILSAAMRRSDGAIAMAIGEHEQYWIPTSGEHSTETQIQVPILSGNKPWGQLELRYRPVTPDGLMGIVHNPWLKLLAFMSFVCFTIFYLYLGKVLRHLDPSQAIPGRVRAALDTLAEGLLVIDKKQNIVLANQSFAEFLGKSPDELLGYNAGDLEWLDESGNRLPSDHLPWLLTLNDGSNQTDFMLNIRNSKSVQKNFIVNCSPVLGSGRKPNGVFISLNDVTQLEQNKVELHKAKDMAESANRSKSEFLANMSHEIRTPMNAILGFTELLQRGYSKNQEDSAKFLNTIHSSGKHLLELINDILDLSKIEAGQMEMELIPCAPHKVIREVITIMTARAQEKNLKLDLVPKGKLPATILSDPLRLRQIITNILGNAIKFTENGSIKVEITFSEQSGNPMLEIDIIDSGIGIQQDKLESIFNPFEQADTSITRRFGGTGLGLSISRRFARALGGDIVASSIPGRGSTFAVMIETGALDQVSFLTPEEILGDDSAAAGGDQGNWIFPAGKRILVVDDGPENRELVTLVLEENGLKVEQAENGQVGMEMALTGKFDLILMDMSMPVMDGFTSTRLIRENGLTLPVFALTAHAMKGFEKEIMDVGCSGYLTKPIDIDHLMTVLAETLGGYRSETGSKPMIEIMHKEPATSVSQIDAPLISRLSGKPRLRPAIEKFTGRLDEQLNLLETAYKKNDFAEIASLAHWLKGAAGTVGYDAFTEPAAELEQQAKAGQVEKVAASIQLIRNLESRIVVLNGSESDANAVTESEHIPAVSREHTIKDLPINPGASANQEPIFSALAHKPRLVPTIAKFTPRLQEQLNLMDQILNKQDFNELENLAHWLKGAAGTVGYNMFTEPAEQLENSAKAQSTEGCARILSILHGLANRIKVPDTPPAMHLQQKQIQPADQSQAPAFGESKE